MSKEEVFRVSYPHSERQNVKYCVHSWRKKCVILNNVWVKKTHCSTVTQFSQCISIHTSFVPIILWYKIWVAQNGEDSWEVWVGTPCSLVHGYERFRGTFWMYLHRLSEGGRSMPWLKLPWYPSFRLQGPITWRSTILNLNSLHFLCIVLLSYLLQAN